MKEIYVANIKGETGDAAKITISRVVTLPPGSKAEVINEGTPTDAQLVIKIPEGEGFRIHKTYPSVAAMNAGYETDNEVPLYGFVLIDTGSVEDEENARLYVKGETGYEFLTDLSGAQGIKGETGAKGDKGESISSIQYVETNQQGIVFRAVLTDGTNAGDFLFPTPELTADKVVLKEDIILAGDYVQVGNVTKGSQTATGTFAAKGKTVAQVIQEIFTKRLQPNITRQPSVYGFTFNMAGRSVEVGTHINSLTVGTLNLDKGSYTYDSETGIEATDYCIMRIVNGISTEISNTQSYVDTNSDAGFTISDGASISYRGTITYTEGNIASDNLGEVSEPPIRIEAGTATSTTLSALTGYRNYFYGTVSNASPPSGTTIDSDIVRGFTKSGRAYSSGSISINVPKGATGVYIACLAEKIGVTKVINKTALNADVTATFIKQTDINVEGLNGYAAKPYNVWYFIPAVPYDNEAQLEVTLG